MDRRIISIHRRGKAWIDHAAFAHFDIDAFSQAVVDGESRVNETGEEITAGGAHDGWTDIRRTFGLISAPGEVEKQMIALLIDLDVKTDRFIEFDAVAIDKSFAFADPIRPRSDFRA